MQTVTLINKSGKVVSTGKHLAGVFNDAKSAYKTRKAELAVVRETKHSEKQARKAIEQLSLADSSDNASRPSSKRSRGSSRSSKSSICDSSKVSISTTDRPRPSRKNRPSALRNEYFMDDGENHRNELVRRHSDTVRAADRPKTSRSASVNDIDMDLAYGELPPPLPLRRNDELELREKMSKLQNLLDEANCMQHSVVAIIDNLQKNPDAMAAVMLTLGEISTVASKMAPGMLLALKGSFPAIIALLAAPEFLIAAGVGVGVTVIVLGGYKIVKKIKQKKENKRLLRLEGAGEDDASSQAESAESFDELRELSSDLTRIEAWRREIADAQQMGEGSAAGSMATSVDGEFVTPGANKYLIAEGVLNEEDSKSTKTGRSSKKSSRSKKGGEAPSTKTKKPKKKEVSGLRMLFKTKA